MVTKLLNRYPAFTSARISRGQLERLVRKLVEKLPDAKASSKPRNALPAGTPDALEGAPSPLVSPQADPQVAAAAEPTPDAAVAPPTPPRSRGGLLGALRRQRPPDVVPVPRPSDFDRPLSAPAAVSPIVHASEASPAVASSLQTSSSFRLDGSPAAAVPAPTATAAPASKAAVPGDASAAPSATATNDTGPGGVAAPTAAGDMGDLQRVSAISLRMAKARMDVDFEEKQLKPGDPGYVYDKQVDFDDANEPSGWDDDDDDDWDAEDEEDNMF